MKRFLKNVLLIIATLVAFYYTVRFTYHQGWWGKDNLIARSMWLCSGPPELEESFYPDNVDVLVSACDAADRLGNQSKVYVLPEKGSLQLISYDPEDAYEWYFVDLVSGEESIQENKAPEYGIIYWVSPDMLLIKDDTEIVRRYFLYKPSTQEFLLEIQYLPDAMEYLMSDDEKTIKVPEFAAALQAAEKIVLYRNGGMVLAENYMQNPDKNFLFSADWLPMSLDEFLSKYEINYELAPQATCSMRQLSPSGRFEALSDGIYTVSDGKLLAAYNLGEDDFYAKFGVCGWIPAESAVILSYHAGGPFGALQLLPPDIAGPGFFMLPQPVLKFYLSEELVQ